MTNDVITQDGEIIEGMGLPSSMAVQLQKAEIDQLITTARAFPRSLKRVQSSIMSMATLDEESAEECMYALPRGGKPIKGPSIRFAEILRQSFGNCRAAARVVSVDRVEMYVEAEGVFHDLETNSSTTQRVRRRISDKHGKLLKDDMIIVTGNAACAIAMRNSILAGVPKPLWRKAYETVQSTITGDVTTLSENREKSLKALAAFGVKPEQIFASLGREGLEDITVDDIATLRGMYSALKNGEATVEEMFFGTVRSAEQKSNIRERLEQANAATQPTTEAPEGFDADHVQRETSRVLDGEILDTDAPTSSPAVSVEGDGSSPSPSPISLEDRQSILDFARKTISNIRDQSLGPEIKMEAIKSMEMNYRDVIPESLWRKLSTVRTVAAKVLGNERTIDEGIAFISENLECKASEIGGDA